LLFGKPKKLILPNTCKILAGIGMEYGYCFSLPGPYEFLKINDKA